MAQLIHPQSIVTRDGELIVHFTIDLNVNVNTSGDVTPNKESVKDEPDWEVPEFKPAPKIQFGKKI